MIDPSRRLRLGTRASRLALAQASETAAALEAAHGWPAGTVEVVPMTTTGDRVQDRSLAAIGGKELWTRELDRALLAGEVDACVHSMKDVESERPPELTIAAMLERADPRDRLIGAGSVDDLGQGAVIGTSSPRRAAQLKRLRPDLVAQVLRGNVETRLGKLAEGEVDATLLAAAGLDRLGLDVGFPVSLDILLPAPGQAAIGIECRSDDDAAAALVAAINHPDTFDCVEAERAFTRALGGSCASPVAALGSILAEGVRLRVQILSADGRELVEDEGRFARGDGEGPAALARAMLDRAPAAVRSLFDAP
jgi:hydroxymethylbilane synthase